MISTNVFDFRKKLAGFLDEVEKKGTRIVIKRFGKPMAVINKYEEEESDFDKFFGMFPRKETGEEYVNKIRRSGKEKKWTTRYE